MNLVVAQQVSLDNDLVAPKDRIKIEKCNIRIDPTNTQKEATYQVVLDTLALSPCYNTFLITADINEIYMQQFWFTISKIKDSSSYKFKLDNKKISCSKLTTEKPVLKDERTCLIPDSQRLLSYTSSLKISKDNQVYGKTIPGVMINQEIKNSTTYQTYLAYSTGAAKPKKAGKWKQPASTPKKNTSFTTDDNIITDDPDAALELAKSVSRIEAEEQETTRHTPTVKKKKTPYQSLKLKGIELLYDAAMLEADIKKAMKASLRDLRPHHQTGVSSEGAGLKPKVPNELKGKSINISEGAGSKPEVPDVSKAMSSDQESENESWGESEDDDDDDRKSDDERTESDNDTNIDLNNTNSEEELQGDKFELYDDVNMERKDAKLVDEGKGNEEITVTEKVDVEHEEINQEVASAKVQDKV
ncbi:hypothetical protein Tco_0650100 [Tanacetum coccineum]